MDGLLGVAVGLSAAGLVSGSARPAGAGPAGGGRRPALPDQKHRPAAGGDGFRGDAAAGAGQRGEADRPAEIPLAGCGGGGVHGRQLETAVDSGAGAQTLEPPGPDPGKPVGSAHPSSARLACAGYPQLRGQPGRRLELRRAARPAFPLSGVLSDRRGADGPGVETLCPGGPFPAGDGHDRHGRFRWPCMWGSS